MKKSTTKKLDSIKEKKARQWSHDWGDRLNFAAGFDAGVASVLEAIWHTKKEMPKENTTCFLIATHGGFMARERIEQMDDWHRWAYIEDLLPDITEQLEVVRGILGESEEVRERLNKLKAERNEQQKIIPIVEHHV